MSENDASINTDSSLLVAAPPTESASIDEPLNVNEPIWYSVTVGRNPGVFCGPQSIIENTSRIPESLAIRHDTEELARAHFHQACLEGRARRVYLDSSRQRLGPDDIHELTPLSHPEHPIDPTIGRWYSLTVARAPGVYFGVGTKITSLTVGIKGQNVDRFDNHEEARAAFLADLASGRVVRAVYDLREEVLSVDDVE